MEINDPMCIYLVVDGSSSDKMLFRFPYCSFGKPIKLSPSDLRLTLDKGRSMSAPNVHTHELANFRDSNLSCLFASLRLYDPEFDHKFELKMNNVIFIGHPIYVKSETSGPGYMFNIVFAVSAFASRQITNCYYDLSKTLAVALYHEEKRCGYVTEQVNHMLYIHEIMTSELLFTSDAKGCSLPPFSDNLEPSFENGEHFQNVLENCSLAQDLKTVFEDICSHGVIKLKVNNWVEVSFCFPHKVHRFHTDERFFEPDFIDKCLKGMKPYHALLLLADRKTLLDGMPQDCSPSIIRLINICNPVKNLQSLSADADLTITQVFNIAGHLIYWGDATLIFPLSEYNVYATAPNIPTERNNEYAVKFAEKFAEHNLLEVLSEFSIPTTLQYKICPAEDRSNNSVMIQIIIWLLQHKMLLQYHSYIYFMPTYDGLVTGLNKKDSQKLNDNEQTSRVPMTTYQRASGNCLRMSSKRYRYSMAEAEEMFNSLSLKEKTALTHIPAALNSDDLHLLMRLVSQGYFTGDHHIEEIMFLENIRRSRLLQLLDKFKEVLIVVEMEDPIISNFYSH